MRPIWIFSLVLFISGCAAQQVSQNEMEPALAAGPVVHIVALGGSFTAGKGARESYPEALEKLLREDKINAVVVNKGVAGMPSASMVGELDFIPDDTALVILSPGDNDLRQISTVLTGDIKENARIIITKLQARHISVILLGAGKPGKSIARELHVHWVRGLGKRVPADQRRGDQQHLTAQGYLTAARLILPDVEAVLAARQTSE